MQACNESLSSGICDGTMTVDLKAYIESRAFTKHDPPHAFRLKSGQLCAHASHSHQKKTLSETATDLETNQNH
jgi:multimeric flavodoxin WrbA